MKYPKASDSYFHKTQTRKQLCCITNDPLPSVEIWSRRYRTDFFLTQPIGTDNEAVNLPKSLFLKKIKDSQRARLREERTTGKKLEKDSSRSNSWLGHVHYLRKAHRRILSQLQKPATIMDSLDGSSYDVLISGTGIQQSLLALYVSSCFAV